MTLAGGYQPVPAGKRKKLAIVEAEASGQGDHGCPPRSLVTAAPIEQAMRIETPLNLKTAKALGIQLVGADAGGQGDRVVGANGRYGENRLTGSGVDHSRSRFPDRRR